MPHVRTVAAAALGAYAALQVLGRRAGSTSAERRTPLPGDALVPHPQLRTDHAITIDASPEAVWPWLTQMGWHRGGYYTPEWVDRLLFPQNRPSLGHLDPSLVRDLRVGDTIPDGPPGTAWYDVVEVAAPTTLVLRSSTHLPPGWADRYDAAIDWTWSVRLRRLNGARTRLQLRVRGRMSPRWLTVLYVATIVPADFVMARGMLRGIKSRVEAGSDDAVREIAPGVFCLGPAGRTQTNVFFVRDGGSWTLVDAGWAADADRIERAARALLGPDVHPAGIVLTHCHPDHSGAAAYLAAAWGCPVYLHPAELPIGVGDLAAMGSSAGPLDRWLILPLVRAMGARRRAAVLSKGSLQGVGQPLDPNVGARVPGMPSWECVPTPGHTPGHLSYLRRSDRVLIAGDALVTMQMNSATGLLLGRPGLSGPPWYTTWNQEAASRSVLWLARLRPSVLASGHGEPMTGEETATAISDWAEGGRADRPFRGGRG
ncbi:MAG TPA: MBL fold metallo-hydrolase [Nocardioidaceae bacterium]|nr:MBL fold metallo-hydrolase [Nocardioidaceae bacterium]